MSLADHLNATRPNCRFATVYASLDSEDQAALDSALADVALSTAHITRALRAEKHQIGEDSVRRHRTGACACH